MECISKSVIAHIKGFRLSRNNIIVLIKGKKRLKCVQNDIRCINCRV